MMPLAPLRTGLSCASRRAFSTTPRAFNISPESPSYIEIPRPPQIRSIQPPRKKGKLPHPKSLPLDLDATPATPEPSQESQRPLEGVDEETKAYIKWKSALAENRRRNLREGVAELQLRQKNQAAHRAKVLKKRTEEREEKLDAGQREDVRLTLPSVLSTLRLDDGSTMQRITPERLAEKSALREAKEAARTAARIESFHNLYLNAKDFIITEKQLDEAIEKEFGPMDHLYKSLPPTVEDMLLQASNIHGDFSKNPKLMQIAGELTGAKLMPERSGSRDTSAFGADHDDDSLVNRTF
ncbi:hypothetical protein DFP73DRAFT_387323 [Morchella snyderi]|nr:hypothetical protein DFP73DRAFT_387323 [Morchella snyderi]